MTLLAPPPARFTRLQAWQYRFVGYLSLACFACALVLTVAVVGYKHTLDKSELNLLIIGLFLAVHLVNRRGRVKAASWLLIAGTTAVLMMGALTVSPNNLLYMGATVLAAGLLLGAREALALAGLNLAFTLVLPLLRPELTIMPPRSDYVQPDGFLLPYLVVEAIYLIFGGYFGRLGRDLIGSLEAQHAKLESAYQSLLDAEYRASLDSLTHVCNHGAFQRRLAEAFAPVSGEEAAYSLLLLDVDHFKLVNDHCGHVAGDAVLRAVAGCMRSAVGEAGLVARYGGDEFAILLPSADLAQANVVAEAVRRTVRQFDLTTVLGGNEAVTLSIGIAQREPDDLTPAAAIERADRALYFAKTTGRDRSVVAYA